MILLDGYPATEEQIVSWMERKNGYYVELLQEIRETNLLPGVESILQDIQRAGYLAGLASASKNARDVVQKLNIGYFLNSISDGYSVEAPKPAPDLFLHAARSLGLHPEECVVAEDAEAGIDAGIAAGMKTIGIGPMARVGKADIVLENGFDGITLADIIGKLLG
jgi:kojibiose phosphorylase